MALMRQETYTERTRREQEEARRAAEARVNGTGLATSREARAAVPAPQIVKGNVVPEQPAPQAIKGAVKVDAFPERSKYPFAAIAEDGGVWCIDPAAYKAKATSVYTAARKWAQGKGLAAETLVHDGQVYVQFKGGA